MAFAVAVVVVVVEVDGDCGSQLLVMEGVTEARAASVAVLGRIIVGVTAGTDSSCIITDD